MEQTVLGNIGFSIVMILVIGALILFIISSTILYLHNKELLRQIERHITK